MYPDFWTVVRLPFLYEMSVNERMLELLSKDASYVSMENLKGIQQWYREECG